MAKPLSSYLSLLPQGWYPSQQEKAGALYQELQKELPPEHLLYQKNVRVIAHREGTDDVLCWHPEEPERFTVIHLSWVGKTEINKNFPGVEVDGNFENFLEYERAFGL